MRILIVSESFLPNVNGVVHSVMHVMDFLREHGHDVLLIAPGLSATRKTAPLCESYAGFPLLRTRAIRVPLINSLPVSCPSFRLERVMRDFAPDVVHSASPFVLGAQALFVARRLGIPSVAIYQTDIPSYTKHYHLGFLESSAWHWTRTLHAAASRTLAPSSATCAELSSHGVSDVFLWPRGVDTELFSPAQRHSPKATAFRRLHSPAGLPVVGYVGRLAAEKRVDRLRVLEPLVRSQKIVLLIVGDGPGRARLQQTMPWAHWVGALSGKELATAYACMDVFVHPGEHETFGQTLQEALASGVGVIAPRAGGPIDLVRPGINGELLPVSDYERKLPEAVMTALEHAESWGRAAYEGVQHRSWEKVCADLLEHYEAVRMRRAH